MKKVNLVELIKENVTINGELQQEMFEILESNIEDFDTLEEVKYYMENNAVCVTGAVGGLIYYSETKEIFKNHFEEILELVEEYKEEMGEINIDFNYNNLVWFAFEYLNRKWFYEIESLEDEEEEGEE